MIGLLIKDWKLLKNQGKYFFTMLVITILLITFSSEEYSSFATSYLTFLIAYLSLSTISYDEYDNGMGFLMTLPISRRLYVAEKYVLAILLTAGAWLFSFGLNMFCLRSHISDEVFREMLCTQPVFLLIVLIFLGISLPLFLKYGPEKGRMVSFGFIGVTALAIVVMGKMGIGITELRAVDLLSIEQPFLMFGICILLSILIIIFSYMISLKLMERKEY